MATTTTQTITTIATETTLKPILVHAHYAQLCIQMSTHRLFSNKRIVFGEEEHTVTLVPFSHWHTRAVPEPILRFRFLIFVEPAGAQWRSERHLVLSKALNDDGGDGFVRAKLRTGVFEVGVGKERHGLSRLPDGLVPFFFCHVRVLGSHMECGPIRPT